MKQQSVLLSAIFVLFAANLYAREKVLKVAVVGGGMAGVAAAHYIQEADPGANISLFEKEAVIGGNARTIMLPGANGREVAVDAGPQYFTDGPWDEYIRFLKAYDMYNTDEISEFRGSISIQSEASGRPRLITPLYGSFRGENLSKLLWFKRFFSLAYKVYRNPETVRGQDLGSWVRSLPLPPHFKDEVIIPFLAASLGTTTGEIQETAVPEIVKLFAFRRPSMRNSFKVLHRGMGSVIRQASAELEKKGLKVYRSAPVTALEKDSGMYILKYVQGDQTREEKFHFVILAVHPYQAARILKADDLFTDLTPVLERFRYFKARIVLHRDSSFSNTRHPAFLNIFTTADNHMRANTMNLGMIDKRYAGLYKSWLTEELCTQVKARGLFLHETVFNHPLITPEFSRDLKQMHLLMEKRRDLFIGGGWTQGLETQETALVSGRKAMEKYMSFKAGDF